MDHLDIYNSECGPLTIFFLYIYNICVELISFQHRGRWVSSVTNLLVGQLHTVALSFVFDKYYPIMDQLVSKDSSRQF